MRLRPIFAGLMLISLLSSEGSAYASTFSMMRTLTQDQFLMDDQGKPVVSVPVQRFASKALSTDKRKILRKEVPQAFDPLALSDLCAKKDYRDAISIDRCQTTFAADIQSLAKREERVRALGKQLESIAASYEFPVLNPAYSALPEQARSIIRIWQAGSGSLAQTHSGLLLREAPVSRDDNEKQGMKALVKKIGDGLQSMIVTTDNGGEDRDQFTATVWLFQHGVRFMRGERPEFPAPPTLGEDTAPGRELERLRRNDDPKLQAVEKAMLDLWSVLQARPSDPKLRTKEILWFTGKELQDGLPDSVMLWAYIEDVPGKKPTDPHKVSGDIGFFWTTPPVPVLPSLCGKLPGGSKESTDTENLCDIGDITGKNVTTLGGTYPLPAPDGTGLCTQPFQRLGYLCRPQNQDDNPVACAKQLKPAAGQIVLGSCAGTTGTRATLAGPDACADVTWKENQDVIDPNTQCHVEIGCKDLQFGGKTEAKDSKGIIYLNLKTRDLTKQSPPVPLFLHELTHVKQACGQPPGYQPYTKDMAPPQYQAACCQVEGEAYRAQCQAYEQDGMFKPKPDMPLTDDGKAIALTISGKKVPLNVETCWQVLTDASCRERSTKDLEKEVQCPATFTFGNSDTASIQNAAFKQMTDLMFENLPADEPHTCKQAVDPKNFDPRLQAAIRDINQTGKQACDPGTLSKFDNTIGNNVCVVNQCLEVSFQEHRVTPGRAPLVSGETAFPADICEPVNPAGSTLSTQHRVRTNLPAYEPALLIQQIDESFCQSNGLPPKSPPILCDFSATRVLTALPDDDPLRAALRILDQSSQAQNPVANREKLLLGLGARLSSALFSNYLEGAAGTLADITDEGAALLKQFTQVQFPTAMCPYKDTGDWLLSTPFCKNPSSSSSSVSSQ